ncbi:LRR1 [Lepeophtheirus salmonis]|uniref:mRNA export factor GLE1 n=1 Tax=Lepeophtheirus salmonis TaxID=72036 RepID=A0A7R8D1W2_LEPSM|nr:LRR1 [Lepeophtheirus salmonis]CAF2999726.1 LRR1 [Lepeophtheirus salmonis]
MPALIMVWVHPVSIRPRPSYPQLSNFLGGIRAPCALFGTSVTLTTFLVHFPTLHCSLPTSSSFAPCAFLRQIRFFLFSKDIFCADEGTSIVRIQDERVENDHQSEIEKNEIKPIKIVPKNLNEYESSWCMFEWIYDQGMRSPKELVVELSSTSRGRLSYDRDCFKDHSSLEEILEEVEAQNTSLKVSLVTELTTEIESFSHDLTPKKEISPPKSKPKAKESLKENKTPMSVEKRRLGMGKEIAILDCPIKRLNRSFETQSPSDYSIIHEVREAEIQFGKKCKIMSEENAFHSNVDSGGNEEKENHIMAEIRAHAKSKEEESKRRISRIEETIAREERLIDNTVIENEPKETKVTPKIVPQSIIPHNESSNFVIENSIVSKPTIIPHKSDSVELPPSTFISPVPKEISTENQSISLSKETSLDKQAHEEEASSKNVQIYLKATKYNLDIKTKLLAFSDKSLKFDLQKGVSTIINAICQVSKAHLKEKLEKLTFLSDGQPINIGDSKTVNSSSDPYGIDYVKFIMAEKFISHWDEQPKSIFALGAVMAALSSHVPYILPYYYVKKEFESLKEYRTRCGYSYNDDQEEDKEMFLKHMSGIIRLYTAYSIAELPQSHSDRVIDHGVGNLWRLVSSTLNLNPINEITAIVLCEVFEIAGHVLLETYKDNFICLLDLAQKQYIPKIKEVTLDGDLFVRFNLIYNRDKIGAMKLKGVILITDRSKPNCNNSGKFISGLFAIGSKNKQDKDSYLSKENIDKLFLRFMAEGKCTFRFKEPPHDVAIKSNSNELKQFINSIKTTLLSLQPGYKATGVSLPMLAPVSLSEISKPKEKLFVQTKKDYPLSKGFPSSLTTLVINQINLQRLDTRILKLRNLVTLNLDSCSLTQLPPVWDRLTQLASLQLSNNSLDTLPPEFCQGSLCDTLQILDLRANKFRRLPRYICNLKSVHTLKVDNNELIEFPPSVAFFMKMDFLDLSGNFMDWDPHVALPRPPIIKDTLKKLKVLSARSFLGSYSYKKIPKPDVIPFTLVEYLMSFQMCLCGVYATDEFMGYGRMGIPEISTSYRIDSSDSGVSLRLDVYFFSLVMDIELGEIENYENKPSPGNIFKGTIIHWTNKYALFEYIFEHSITYDFTELSYKLDDVENIVKPEFMAINVWIGNEKPPEDELKKGEKRAQEYKVLEDVCGQVFNFDSKSKTGWIKLSYSNWDIVKFKVEALIIGGECTSKDKSNRILWPLDEKRPVVEYLRKPVVYEVKEFSKFQSESIKNKINGSTYFEGKLSKIIDSQNGVIATQKKSVPFSLKRVFVAGIPGNTLSDSLYKILNVADDLFGYFKEPELEALMTKYFPMPWEATFKEMDASILTSDGVIGKAMLIDNPKLVLFTRSRCYVDGLLLKFIKDVNYFHQNVNVKMDIVEADPNESHGEYDYVAVLVWLGEKPKEEDVLKEIENPTSYRAKIIKFAPIIPDVGITSGVLHILNGSSFANERVIFNRDVVYIFSFPMAKGDLAYVLKEFDKVNVEFKPTTLDEKEKIEDCLLPPNNLKGRLIEIKKPDYGSTDGTKLGVMRIENGPHSQKKAFFNRNSLYIYGRNMHKADLMKIVNESDKFFIDIQGDTGNSHVPFKITIAWIGLHPNDFKKDKQTLAPHIRIKFNHWLNSHHITEEEFEECVSDSKRGVEFGILKIVTGPLSKRDVLFERSDFYLFNVCLKNVDISKLLKEGEKIFCEASEIIGRDRKKWQARLGVSRVPNYSANLVWLSSRPKATDANYDYTYNNNLIQWLRKRDCSMETFQSYVDNIPPSPKALELTYNDNSDEFAFKRHVKVEKIEYDEDSNIVDLGNSLVKKIIKCNSSDDGLHSVITTETELNLAIFLHDSLKKAISFKRCGPKNEPENRFEQFKEIVPYDSSLGWANKDSMSLNFDLSDSDICSSENISLKPEVITNQQIDLKANNILNHSSVKLEESFSSIYGNASLPTLCSNNNVNSISGSSDSYFSLNSNVRDTNDSNYDIFKEKLSQYGGKGINWNPPCPYPSQLPDSPRRSPSQEQPLFHSPVGISMPLATHGLLRIKEEFREPPFKRKFSP